VLRAIDLDFDDPMFAGIYTFEIRVWVDATYFVSGSEIVVRDYLAMYDRPAKLSCQYEEFVARLLPLSDCVSGLYVIYVSDAELGGRPWRMADRAWAVVVAPEPGQTCAEVMATRSDAPYLTRPAVYYADGPLDKRHDCPPVRFEAPDARLIGYDTREVLADGSTRPGPQPLGNVLDLGSGLELQIRHDVFEADFRDTIRRFDLLCRYDDGIELAIPVQSGLWGVFGLGRHPPAGAPAGTPVVFERAWALSWTRTGDWPR
jgi:hypothetical protein